VAAISFEICHSEASRAARYEVVMSRSGRFLASFGIVAGLSGLARADDQTQRSVKQQQGVLQIGEITIVGRVQKPIAAVDVAKIQPKLTLAELRQPFLDRIEEASRKDPF
jgi:hypothetical protein